MRYFDAPKTTLPTHTPSLQTHLNTANTTIHRNSLTTTRTHFTAPHSNVLFTNPTPHNQQQQQNSTNKSTFHSQVPNYRAAQFEPPAPIHQYSHAETFQYDAGTGLNVAQKLGREDLICRLQQAELRAQNRRTAEARVLKSYAEDESKMLERNAGKLKKMQNLRQQYVINLQEEEAERSYLMK